MTIAPYDENAAREVEQQRQQPMPIPQGAATSDLVLWAYEAQQANRIAKSLANTSFIPVSMRGKPDDVTAAILTGQELGMKPMAALRSLDVIQGVPALRAHAMRALVQSHGHSVQVVTSTEVLCVMRGRRAGEEEWQQVEWPIERAEKLLLTGKAEWKKQPQTMLVARATGEICRLIAADVLYAVPYASEELDEQPQRHASAEVLRADAPPPVTLSELTGPGEHTPEPAEPVDPDAEAAAQLAEERGWPPVRTPAGEG